MVTDLGFIRPTLDEIEAEIQADFVAKFSDGGENNPDLEPESFLGALSSILAEIKNDLYEIAENEYFSLFLTTASGIALDRMAPSTIRIDAIKAITDVDLEGDVLVVVPANTFFETEDGIQYATDEEVTLDGVTGLATVGVTAVVAGVTGNAPIGAIRFIPVPVSDLNGDLNTVTNSAPATGGAPIETDSSFRERAIEDQAADRTSSLPAIRNRILEVPGVTSVIGFENNLNIVVDGRPSKSFEMVVRGGNDLAIATAIFNSKAAGMLTFGTETEIVIDNAGDPHSINFSRITQVSISVEITLVTNVNYNPVTAEPEIRQRVLDYIGGVNPDTIESEGVQPAEDIFAWKIAGTLFELDDPDGIPGIEEQPVVLISKTPAAPSLDKIVIADTEEAFTDFSEIDIL